MVYGLWFRWLKLRQWGAPPGQGSQTLIKTGFRIWGVLMRYLYQNWFDISRKISIELYQITSEITNINTLIAFSLPQNFYPSRRGIETHWLIINESVVLTLIIVDYCSLLE